MRRSLKIIALMAASSLAGLAAAHASKTTVDSQPNGKTTVTAPGTRVAVLPKRGKVHVEAPYSDIKVDTEARRVRIRVPFYNGDISW